jgi:ribonuclease HII
MTDSKIVFECGVDEVARGCLFGRVYAGAVIWPDGTRCPSDLPKGVVVRDSKKMSAAQRGRAAAWIKENAVGWSVAYQTEMDIQNANILVSAIDAMHLAIAGLPCAPDRLAIDGTQFRAYGEVPYRCIPQGDRHHFGIACGAILAKVAHDAYIHAVCDTLPELDEMYGLRRNMGYGTPMHLKGIAEHGITNGHRKGFGPCKTAYLNATTIPQKKEEDSSWKGDISVKSEDTPHKSQCL